MHFTAYSAHQAGSLIRIDVPAPKAEANFLQALDDYVDAFPIDDFLVIKAKWRSGKENSRLPIMLGLELQGASAFRVSLTLTRDNNAAGIKWFGEFIQSMDLWFYKKGHRAIGWSQIAHCSEGPPILGLFEETNSIQHGEGTDSRIDIPKIPATGLVAIGTPFELLQWKFSLEMAKNARGVVAVEKDSLQQFSIRKTTPISNEQKQAFSEDVSWFSNRASAWMSDDERFPSIDMKAFIEWHTLSFAGPFESTVFMDRGLLSACQTAWGGEELLERTGIDANLYERIQTTGISSPEVYERLRDAIDQDASFLFGKSTSQMALWAQLESKRRLVSDVLGKSTINAAIVSK